MISVSLLTSHRAALLLLLCCLHTISSPFFFTNNPFSVLGACTESDHQALLQFLNSFTSYNHSKWIPWNASSSSDCCTWQGVTCDNNPHNSTVTALELPSLNISGTINVLPSSLKTLNLSDNGFHGELPTNLILSLPVLETLDLSNNKLQGRLSDLLPFPPSLKSVNLSYNRFSGELPSNFSNSVQHLILAKNNLSGFVNPGLLCGKSDSLRVLDLSRNGFHGTLSPGFGFCVSLQELDLGFNKFNGAIPDDIFSLAHLSSLSLDNNSFTGTLSSNLSPSLTRLTLANNFVTGPFPKTHLRNLVTLDLSNNNFNGSLSDIDFSNLTSLQVLSLYFNNFTGTIPVSLSNCTSLKVLNLALNFLTGQVPSELNALKRLTFVSLSANKLNGGLQSFQDCDSLVSLYLSKNDFTEPLPASASFTKNLQVLALGFLNLKGTIPLWLKNCTKLQVLDLSWNSFEGQLPPWLGSFKHLIYLDLSNNTLTGSIPLQLFYLPSLVSIDSNFSGLQTVMDPVEVGHHSGLPDLTYFRALSLPPSIILSNNKLTGSIPSLNKTIKVLAVLDLSHNDLTGSIPDSLSRIKNLERLDLSSNRLTGNIPSSLSKLTFLSTFNVSFNSLVGPIPMSNQFGSFSNSSYIGNPGLCGVPILSSCSSNSSQSSSNSSNSQSVTKKQMVAIVVIICVVVVFTAISVTVFLAWVVSGRTAVHHGFGNSSEINDGRCQSEAQHATVQLLYNDKQLSVADIFHGTNNFNANNIVGCGGYGLVYRADLEDGSKLAIKKLTGDCGQMEREFKAEVEALSKARHNNLVPLKGFMQIGHSKLLIYAYMENGSLDYWLHERIDGAACLDWQTRLKIAHGAAAGLAYLHQICYPHIVHRDIKSSNILLDEMFEARLADFGLARLMMSTDTHVSTELVGTLGYIPPEYSEKANATPRGDVYSFGVVLLELLTGRRPVDVCGSKESSDLVSWVQQLRHTTNIDDVFDKSLREKGFEEQMRKVLDIALTCINRDPQKRPSIKEVMFLLEEIRQAKLEEIRQNKLVTT